MSLEFKVKKDFGGFTLDMELNAENEVLALLGASGCGKSMTLKCISGIVTPAAGYVIMGLMSFALGVCLTLVIFRLRGAEKKRMSDRMGHSDDKSKNKSDDNGDRDAAAGRRR